MNGLALKVLAALITALALGAYGFSWNLYSNVGVSLTRIENRIDGIYEILLSQEE